VPSSVRRQTGPSGARGRAAPTRCGWAQDPLDIIHHDEEWGVPEHDDVRLFEFLILEGAQAGLSWMTILRKRDGYRKAFAGFDPVKVARFTAADVRRLLADDRIVRNRAKIEATIANARAFLVVQREFGSFDAYLRRLVGARPIRTAARSHREQPAETEGSRTLSRDLAKRGFRFVGPTICYAFMQSVGLVNDHVIGCFRRSQVTRKAPGIRPSVSGRQFARAAPNPFRSCRRQKRRDSGPVYSGDQSIFWLTISPCAPLGHMDWLDASPSGGESSSPIRRLPAWYRNRSCRSHPGPPWSR
jgi:DNA-3-methyladenine glycosylase I